MKPLHFALLREASGACLSSLYLVPEFHTLVMVVHPETRLSKNSVPHLLLCKTQVLLGSWYKESAGGLMHEVRIFTALIHSSPHASSSPPRQPQLSHQPSLPRPSDSQTRHCIPHTSASLSSVPGSSRPDWRTRYSLSVSRARCKAGRKAVVCSAWRKRMIPGHTASRCLTDQWM